MAYHCTMPCWLSVPWIQNNLETVSPAKHPHTITPPLLCFTVRSTHAEIIRVPTLSLTKTQQLELKICNCSNSTMKAWFTQSPLNSWCWRGCYLNSVTHLFGLQSEVQLIEILQQRKLWVFLYCGCPHESQFHHSTWMVFATALEETFKGLEMFRIYWPSCLKVIAIIWTWSFTK